MSILPGAGADGTSSTRGVGMIDGHVGTCEGLSHLRGCVVSGTHINVSLSLSLSRCRRAGLTSRTRPFSLLTGSRYALLFSVLVEVSFR